MEIECCIKLPTGIIPSDQYLDFFSKDQKFIALNYSKLDLELLEEQELHTILFTYEKVFVSRRAFTYPCSLFSCNLLPVLGLWIIRESQNGSLSTVGHLVRLPAQARSSYSM